MSAMDCPRLLQRAQYADPVEVVRPANDAGEVEFQMKADVQKARNVLGPLQVAGHPEQSVGYS